MQNVRRTSLRSLMLACRAMTLACGCAVTPLFACCIEQAFAESQPSSAHIPARPEGLVKTGLEFKPHHPETWTLKNGLKVFYLHDDELPMVRGILYLPGGSLFDPPDLHGAIDSLGDQMREGGIKGIAPGALDKRLADLAASIESGYGSEFGAVGFSCLSEDFDEVFGLMSKVVREPAFDESRLKLWKEQGEQSIRRRRDDPGTMALLAYAKLVYGESSPYAASASIDSLRKISSKSLRDLHHRWVRPNGSRLVIVGAVPREEIEKEVEKYFGTWEAHGGADPDFPPVDVRIRPGVYVLERDFDQATVVMGHLGPPRFPPDIYQMSVYNRLFGSGEWGSLLFTEVRTKLGLAYGIAGGLAPGPGKGTFAVSVGTRADEVTSSVQKVLEIIRQTIDKLPPDGYFREAKSSITQSFVFRFDSALALANRAAQLEISGYPPDYDETYLDRVAAVTPQMVQEVGKRWVHPDEIVIVIVGRVDAKRVKEALQGSVKKVYKLEFDTEPHVGAKVE